METPLSSASEVLAPMRLRRAATLNPWQDAADG
jgi:hypothetical protein